MGDDYLDIAEKSDAPVRAVWQLTQRWAREGELSVPSRHKQGAEGEKAGVGVMRMSSIGP